MGLYSGQFHPYGIPNPSCEDVRPRSNWDFLPMLALERYFLQPFSHISVSRSRRESWGFSFSSATHRNRIESERWRCGTRRGGRRGRSTTWWTQLEREPKDELCSWPSAVAILSNRSRSSAPAAVRTATMASTKPLKTSRACMLLLRLPPIWIFQITTEILYLLVKIWFKTYKYHSMSFDIMILFLFLF